VLIYSLHVYVLYVDARKCVVSSGCYILVHGTRYKVCTCIRPFCVLILDRMVMICEVLVFRVVLIMIH